MKFTEFKIKNFKGIENITINLDKSPNANIYTLVGLNESGKTTILQAISLFNPSDKDTSALKLPEATNKNYNSLIPINRRDNFNDSVTIEVTLKLDDEDLQKINTFTVANTPFRQVKPVDTLKYYRHYKFKNSRFTDLDSRWSGFDGWLKNDPKKNYINIGQSELFSWDEIPGNDSKKLIDFLKHKFSIDRVQTAKIEKIDIDETIKVSTENNIILLKLNTEKTKLNIEIDNTLKSDEFIAKKKNDKLIIYDQAYDDGNFKLAYFCDGLIPSILFFPNFLFDFPSKIFLKPRAQPTDKERIDKEKFYIELIQDILFSLGKDINIKTHLIDRIQSSDADDKNSLDGLLLRMEQKITKIVFEAWNEIFKKEIKDTRIAIRCNIESGFPYLQFNIKAEDGIYNLNERSLGFRWFFTFLLFTSFRQFREGTPKNVIFLFDEPASNLHSSAQQKLLERFKKIGPDIKIIYTTHSHHLINPNWLESTYIVKNEGVEPEALESYSTKKTKISIEPYREFVFKNPTKIDYFQPILDVLDYKPSNLENIPNCVFLEGKNDYYTLAYFNEVIFNNKYKLNLAPSTGSGNLDTLISLYIGWGKEFLIILDSDNEGLKQKSRYIKAFGKLLEQKTYTLQDINPIWVKKDLEKLFEDTEALKFQQTSYPDSTEYNKIHFNRTIQESLINKRDFDFSQQTKDNIEKILSFLSEKINNH